MDTAQMHVSLVSAEGSTVVVEMSGTIPVTPLQPKAPPVSWYMTVKIEDEGPAPAFYEIKGQKSGFPALAVDINGQLALASPQTERYYSHEWHKSAKWLGYGQNLFDQTGSLGM
jgi:hypothetical protein